MTDPAGSKIRVLRVIARANVGGPAAQVHSLATALDPSRFESRLLVGAVGAGETDYLELVGDDVEVVRVPGLGRDPRPLGDSRALHAIMREIRGFRPHVVHTHTTKAGVLGRVAAFARRRSPATVHTFHGHVLHGYFSPMMTRGIVAVERVLARRTSRLVAEGTSVRDDLLAYRIGRADQYLVVPPGIAPGRHVEPSVARGVLGLPPDAVVVAFVARLTAIKRPDRFAAVAHAVAARHPEAVFLVAGDGDLADDLRERLAPLGDRVHMVGFRADVETVYAACDLVVLTSDNEGMPYSLVEAAHAGRPVVATGVGSVADVVVNGETGFVTAPGIDALAHAAGVLVADPETRRRMGRAAAERARARFGLDRLVRDAEALYEDLAEASVRAGGEGDAAP